MYSNLSKREKILFWITISLVILLSVNKFLFTPVFTQIKDLNQEILTKGFKLQKDRRILTQEEAILKELDKYVDYIKQKSSDEEEMAALLLTIESAARSNNIHLSDVKPRQVKKSDFYNLFAVDLKVEGELKWLTQFIYNLQKPPHLLKVERLRLEKESPRRPILKGYILISKILIP